MKVMSALGAYLKMVVVLQLWSILRRLGDMGLPEPLNGFAHRGKFYLVRKHGWVVSPQPFDWDALWADWSEA